MCLLLEKARKDYDTAVYMQKLNDEYYLDICCYHIEQAIERAGTKAGNKGYDCAVGAIEMVNLIREIEA